MVNEKEMLDRIKFLEALLDVNSDALAKSLETNRLLVAELKKRTK